jgi:hypothetical protein
MTNGFIAYARANNANQGSSPSPDSSPSPQEPFRKSPHLSRKVPSPEPNRGHQAQQPTSSPSQASFVSFVSTSFAEGASGQGPGVARLVNRYYMPNQYSGAHSGMYSSSSVFGNRSFDQISVVECVLYCLVPSNLCLLSPSDLFLLSSSHLHLFSASNLLVYYC